MGLRAKGTEMDRLEMTKRVLDCANKVAGTSLKVEVDRDVELAAFNFDSLSVFAFLVELETW